MTVGELIAALGQYDEGAEVRLMTQPSYPLESTVANVVSRYDLDEPLDDGTDPDNVVYLVEGAQVGYGRKDAWQ